MEEAQSHACVGGVSECAAVTVLQRALVADPAAWAITVIHGLICVVLVPLLLRSTWRSWRASNPQQS